MMKIYQQKSIKLIIIFRKAVNYIYSLFFEYNPPIDNSILEEIYNSIFKNILRKFGDKIEVVKEKTMKITIKYLEITNDLLTILPYLFPVLMERIPSDFSFDPETKSFIRNKEKFEEMKRGRAIKKEELERIRLIEPSEEIRYVLLQIIDTLYHRSNELSCLPLLNPYTYDTILLLQAGTVDPFPNARIISFKIISYILSVLPNVFFIYFFRN